MLGIAVSYCLSGVSILGAALNANGKRVGFYVWLVANGGWIIWCVCLKLYGQIPMWVAYSGICVFGLIQWKRKGIDGRRRNNAKQ